MIELKTLASQIETNLNAFNMGTYKVFADVGEFKKAHREGNIVTRYTNGIMEMTSTDVVPFKNLQVATASTRLSFAVDIEQDGIDDITQNFNAVETIREVLNRLVATYNGVTMPMVQEGTTFDVAIAFGAVSVGSIDQLSLLGETLPVYLDIYWTFFENGVNSNKIKVIIDGEDCFYQKYTASRVRTSEANTYTDTDGKIKSIVLNNGLSMTVQTPLLDTKLGEDIYSDIMDGGQNKPHGVWVEKEDKSNAYIMVFGDTAKNCEPGKNVGIDLTLVEGRPELLNYDDFNTETFNTKNHNQTIYLTMPVDSNKSRAIVIWEENATPMIYDNFEGSDINSYMHALSHTYKDTHTDYTIRYKIFNSSDIKTLNVFDIKTNCVIIDSMPNVYLDDFTEKKIGIPTCSTVFSVYTDTPDKENPLFTRIINGDFEVSVNKAVFNAKTNNPYSFKIEVLEFLYTPTSLDPLTYAWAIKISDDNYEEVNLAEYGIRITSGNVVAGNSFEVANNGKLSPTGPIKWNFLRNQYIEEVYIKETSLDGQPIPVVLGDNSYSRIKHIETIGYDGALNIETLENNQIKNCPIEEIIFTPLLSSMASMSLPTRIRKVTFRGDIPPIGIRGAFSGTIYANKDIFVPAESVEAYKTAVGSQLADRVKPIGG